MSVIDSLSEDERALLQPAPRPDMVTAMKAVLTEERFSDPGWIYERKLDGIRCLAIRGGADVQLFSRNDLSQNARYPELVAALAVEPQQDFRRASRLWGSWRSTAASRRWCRRWRPTP